MRHICKIQKHTHFILMRKGGILIPVGKVVKSYSSVEFTTQSGLNDRYRISMTEMITNIF